MKKIILTLLVVSFTLSISAQIRRNILNFTLGVTPRTNVVKYLNNNKIKYTNIKDASSGEYHIMLTNFIYAGQTWDTFTFFFNKGKFVRVSMNMADPSNSSTTSITYSNLFDSLLKKYQVYYLSEHSSSLSKCFSDDTIMISLDFTPGLNKVGLDYFYEPYLLQQSKNVGDDL